MMHILGEELFVRKTNNQVSPISIRQFQDALEEDLGFIDQICKKHHIQYSIMYGTMLGAVREHDSIPWDCDIDICMFEEDLIKFLSLKEEWKERFSFISYLTKTDIFGHTRMIDERFFWRNNNAQSKLYEHLRIDIFTLDTLDMNEKNMRLGKKMNLDRDLSIRLFNRARSKNRLIHFLKIVFIYLFGTFCLHRSISKNKRIFSLVKRNNKFFSSTLYFSDSRMYFNILENDSRYTYIQYGSLFVQCFSNYEEILKKIYGDDYLIPKKIGSIDGERYSFFRLIE